VTVGVGNGLGDAVTVTVGHGAGDALQDTVRLWPGLMTAASAFGAVGRVQPAMRIGMSASSVMSFMTAAYLLCFAASKKKHPGSELTLNLGEFRFPDATPKNQWILFCTIPVPSPLGF
jgi:hypothetical protein